MKENYSDPAEFQLPATDERTVVIGRTGCGKTTLAMMLLSEAPFDQQPYIIFDFKGEDFFRELEQLEIAKEISIGEIPELPGLYIVRPATGRDDDAVEVYLWQILDHENIGLMIDELYMIDPYSDAFQAILTQGRSKNIPMITLTQRPKKVSMFNFSEASHIVVFHLNRQKDRETIEENAPIDKKLRLPEYHSRWYNVNRDKLFHVHPAPGREAIIERFKERVYVPEGEEKPQRIML